MPRDPFVREKFTRDSSAARKLAAEYLQRFPKERYQTEVENWCELQSQNIEFTMKRLRAPSRRVAQCSLAWNSVFDSPSLRGGTSLTNRGCVAFLVRSNFEPGGPLDILPAAF
jgi:hypothetical protein